MAGSPPAGGLAQCAQGGQVRPGTRFGPRQGIAQIILSGTGDGDGDKTLERAAT